MLKSTHKNKPLDYARAKLPASRCLQWKQADALALPFPDAGFDAVVCQFGWMFLPDKVTPEQVAFYVDLFQKVTQTSEYMHYMEEQALKPLLLTGPDLVQFLEEDDALNTSLMTEAGFVAK